MYCEVRYVTVSSIVGSRRTSEEEKAAHVKLGLRDLGTIALLGLLEKAATVSLERFRSLCETLQELPVNLRVNKDTRASATGLPVIPAKKSCPP